MKQTIKKNMSQTNTNLGEGLSYQISQNWKLIFPFILKMFTNVRKNRSEVSKELKGKSGIYLWFNTTNNKFYVGQASNLYNRIARYLTPSFSLFTANTQLNNSSIRSAFIKYGHDVFVLIILEFCEQSQLNNRETYWINFLNAPYNILRTGNSSFGYRHREDSIKRMQGLRPNFKPSVEHRKAISEAAEKENLKRKLNPEYAAMLKNKNIAVTGNSVYVYNLAGNLVNSFASINQFKKEMKITLHHNTIYKRISKHFLFNNSIASLILLNPKAIKKNPFG
jgi:group I intron endonuclease